MPDFDDQDLDEREDDDLEHDDDRDAPDRCVIPGSCIAIDPFHGPDECWTAEMAEAYERELGGEA